MQLHPSFGSFPCTGKSSFFISRRAGQKGNLFLHVFMWTHVFLVSLCLCFFTDLTRPCDSLPYFVPLIYSLSLSSTSIRRSYYFSSRQQNLGFLVRKNLFDDRLLLVYFVTQRAASTTLITGRYFSYDQQKRMYLLLKYSRKKEKKSSVLSDCHRFRHDVPENLFPEIYLVHSSCWMC